MANWIRFTPGATLDAQANLIDFVELVRTRFTLLQALNRFEDSAWNIRGLGQKGGLQRFLYFSQINVVPKEHYPNGKHQKGHPADIPKDLLMREPFASFTKAMLVYLHTWAKTTDLPSRMATFRLMEAALHEMNDSVCPTTVTPEVLDRACRLATKLTSPLTAYIRGKQLELIYRYMVELGLVAVPSTWLSSIRYPGQTANRVGKQFDSDRQKKLPSPLALNALAAIFNSDSEDPTEIFASSTTALMLCDPARSIEMLFAPADILVSDWTDPESGEIGTGLRWFPAKGAKPMVKIVIPSMRDIAIRAINRLRDLSAPARLLARWYEEHPASLFLPPQLEYLRRQEHLNQNEIYAVLFGGGVSKRSSSERRRVCDWLDAMKVPRMSKRTGKGKGTTVVFADLERAVLAKLPEGFPVMDTTTGMRYSETLCIARVGEFDSQASTPSQCCFDRIKYATLQNALKSHGSAKSIFERRDWRDECGKFVFMSSHMLRHYLNTLVRHSGRLTEDEIALWSGRKKISQNSTYNHQSDRDVIAKLRDAVGDPSKSVGPWVNIDDRIFIRRDEFASIKVITAHTTEFGYCIHDYAQSPCQVHQDCINCNELVCVKGDVQAQENLRKIQAELTRLQSDARLAFSDEVLGAAEWFEYQSKTLERVNQLIAILDCPDVSQGTVIQPSGVIPPSRLAMAEDLRRHRIKPVSQSIASLNDVRSLLADANNSETINAR